MTFPGSFLKALLVKEANSLSFVRTSIYSAQRHFDSLQGVCAALEMHAGSLFALHKKGERATLYFFNCVYSLSIWRSCLSFEIPKCVSF